jgi:hypothetical protein
MAAFHVVAVDASTVRTFEVALAGAEISSVGRAFTFRIFKSLRQRDITGALALPSGL